jgi:DNA topoisomerase VI subunit B
MVEINKDWIPRYRNEMKEKRTRIIFDVVPELKKHVKIMAAKNNETMARYISRAIIRQLTEDHK